MNNSKNSESQIILKKFFAGTISSIIARNVTSPIERIIQLIQTNEHKQYFRYHQRNTYFDVIFRLIKKERLKGLFKGNGMNMVRVIPQDSFELFFFKVYQKLLQDNFTFSKNLRNMLAGSLAGSTAYSIMYPIDYTRCMISINKVPKQIKFLKIPIYLKNRDGFLRLYRGLGATILGIFPYCGLKFGFFEYNKNFIKNFRQKDKLNKFENLFAGSLSGMCALNIIYPLDLLRKRRQVQILRSKTRNFTYYEMINHIYTKHGIKGFYRGLSIMQLKVIPYVGTVFMIYEFMNEKLNINKQYQNRILFFFNLKNLKISINILKCSKNF